MIGADGFIKRHWTFPWMDVEEQGWEVRVVLVDRLRLLALVVDLVMAWEVEEVSRQMLSPGSDRIA